MIEKFRACSLVAEHYICNVVVAVRFCPGPQQQKQKNNGELFSVVFLLWYLLDKVRIFYRQNSFDYHITIWNIT